MASRASDEGSAGGWGPMSHPGEAASLPADPARARPVDPRVEESVVRHPARVASGDLSAVLWQLLTACAREDATSFLALLDDAEPALAESTDPHWVAWRHALAGRRALIENDPDAAVTDVAAAREALEKIAPSADTALLMAFLAHGEVLADHFDAAMLLAVDTSLLTDGPAAAEPTRALLQAHRWLSLALAGLDLEEPAVAHAMRGQHVAAALRDPADRWRMRLLSAQQHTELAQTLRRRGDLDRSRELAVEAIAGAVAAREIEWEPEADEADLLDVVQAWALTCAGELDSALGPLRRVRRHVEAEGGLWLRGYTGLALARLLVRLAERDDDAEDGEEAIGLLVDAAGAFAAAGDRRRYRQCLLELGQHCADLGRPAEALHWLEAYRADTGRAHARSRELWADMFVQRSRLRCSAGTRWRTRSPGSATGAAPNAGWARCAWASSRCRSRSSTSTGSRRSTTRPRTPTGTPSSAGWPTCCASTAAPATRSTAGRATSSSSSFPPPPRRRRSWSWSDCARPWPPPTGATSRCGNR